MLSVIADEIMFCVDANRIVKSGAEKNNLPLVVYR